MNTATLPGLALHSMRRRALAARLGTLDDPAGAYAEDVPALLAEIAEHRARLRRAERSIRIDKRLSLK